MKKSVWAIALMVASGGAFGALSDYYVSPGATGDGSSAATPCSMMTAFAAAKGDNTGSTITIHFLDGTYNQENAGIAGGFSRTGTTIVRSASGDAAKVIWIPPTNSRITVVQAPSSGASNLVFEDITFKNSHPTQYQGGALHNQVTASEKGSLTVRRCRFIDCDTLKTSNNERGGAIKLAYGFVYDCYFENCVSKGYGGAIYQGDVDGTVVSNCTFVSCSGDVGGGVFSSREKTMIVGCVISNCVSTGWWKSGGVFIQNGSEVHDTTFIGCRAEGGNSGDGAGGATMTSAASMISNCVFVGCTSTYRSGGAYSQDGSKIVDCRFEGCTSPASYGGGAYSTGGLVSGCTFTNCVSGNSKGGGLFMKASGVATNCAFYDCQSPKYGGAAFFEQSTGVGLTFVGNQTTTGSGGALGMDATTLRNSTIRDNAAKTEAGGIFALGDSVISNCVISGNVSTRGGGVYYYSENGTNFATAAHLKVLDSRIIGNTARIPTGGSGCGQGGGIAFLGFLTVDGCTIASNQTYSMDAQYAKSGAGICCINLNVAPIRLLNSELDGNVGWAWTNTIANANVQRRHDGTYGGNFATSNWIELDGFDCCISNCYLHSGVAEFGGDVYVNYGGVKILDCRIGARGVKAPDGYANGALVFFENATEGLIRNSLLVSSDNATDRAFEFFNGFTTEGKELLVENCTFHGTKVTNCQNSNLASRHVTFNNCAFASTSFASAELGATKNMAFNSCAHLFASPVLSEFPGDGKSFFAADFRFNQKRDPKRDYYDLRGGSPLYNKGVNADWMIGATALNGEPRILGGKVDIGCCEFKATVFALFLR